MVVTEVLDTLTALQRASASNSDICMLRGIYFRERGLRQDSGWDTQGLDMDQLVRQIEHFLGKLSPMPAQFPKLEMKPKRKTRAY